MVSETVQQRRMQLHTSRKQHRRLPVLVLRKFVSLNEAEKIQVVNSIRIISNNVAQPGEKQKMKVKHRYFQIPFVFFLF